MRAKNALLSLSVILLISSQSFAVTKTTTKPVANSSDAVGIAADDAYYPKYPVLNYSKMSPEKAKIVKEGEYLTKMGDCLACHTALNGGKPMAGGLPIKVPPFGTFYTVNITPDKETGIGNMTDAQFIDAMHEGKGHRFMQYYYPVFPYMFFARVIKEDLLKIRAYLNEIPAVHQKNKPNDILLPLKFRPGLFGWRFLFFQPGILGNKFKGYYEEDPSHSKKWNRGAYLVQGLLHCSMCHTPVNALGGPKWDEYMSGAIVDGFYAPNITSYSFNGYTDKQIFNLLKKNELPGHLISHGKVLGPMADAGHNSFSYLKDEDVYAIIEYMRTIPGIAPPPADPHSKHYGSTSASAIRSIYHAYCADCHDNGLQGAPITGDQSNWKYRLEDHGMATMIKNAQDGYGSMPMMGDCMTCSKEQIADVVKWMHSKSVHGYGYAKTQINRTSPPAITAPKATKDLMAAGKQIYMTNCAQCHGVIGKTPNGLELKKVGGPQITDKAFWKDKNDFQAEVAAVWNGKGNMPASKKYCKVGKDNKICETADVKLAIYYLMSQAKPDKNYDLWVKQK